MVIESAKLNAYRQLGLGRLEQLLLELPDEPHEADSFIDRSIRLLTNLPAPPAGAPPYKGIYSSAFTMEQYRNGATSRLLELTLKLPKVHAIDEEVDKYIRVLSDLPAKPAGQDPYVRLFMLREETDDVPEPVIAVPSTVPVAQAKKQYVTAAQVLDIIGSTKLKDRVIALTPGINATFEKFDIDTPLRMAHFFGQVLHESGGFRWLKEIWGPSDAQARYEPPSRLAARLGNTQAGDGKRFMGRGVIQLTGRSNYAQFSKAMGVDFISQPELVESPQYAVMVGGWYWSTRKLNVPADQDDLLKVTRLVNGGTNGLEDRRKYLLRAKKVLGC
jgi:putative chitinase